ncbi:hypothetical protein ABEB36_009196 [Hypothenemus hampei]|uniref:Uncharacterized protein n=1 Tax=Hypothenemus hampei TaxID=57062 RepID=A0ABD1EPH5_HYPHA
MNKNARSYANYVHDDYGQSHELLRKQLRLPVRPRTNKANGSGQRKSFQTTRLETFRETKSKITMDDLSEELRNKLLPGVKDGASAAERLEAANLSKAIVPAITTRSIGIGTVDTFTNIYNLSNVPQRGSIYQLYRVGLAALECQITVTSRSITTIISNEDDFAPLLRSEDMIVAAKGIV